MSLQSHSVSGESIVSHLSNQNHALEMKTEKVLAGFESMDSLALEVETVIAFKTGGGVYLPGLDDNFLADQSATFVLVHFVNFQNGLISQIRQYWDQGTLLKQMGVIGKTGRNWPIKDGKDQIKLVQSSVSKVPPTNSGAPQTRDRGVSNASNGSTASIRPTPDPHSTLSLFTPREQEQVAEIKPAVVLPRTSAKPPPRDLGDLFINSDGVEANGNKAEEVIAPKATSKFAPGHNYDFLEAHSYDHAGDKDSRGVKPDPNKYAHFDMSDNYPDTHAAALKNDRNQPSWDFESFNAPEKKPMRQRPDGVRNFSVGDNQEDTSAAPQRQIYQTKGDGMGGRKVFEEEPPNRGSRLSQAKRAQMAEEEEQQDAQKLKGDVEQLGGGSRTLYRTQGDGMGGRRVVQEEAPARAPRGISAAKRAEMGYGDDVQDLANDFEQLGGGNKTIYRTQGDGMGGRKNGGEERAPAGAPRAFSAAKRAEMDYEDQEQPSGKVDQLGGGNRTIYRTQGDGMGGRKSGGEERAPAGAPRAFSAAKRAEMDYEDQEQPSGKVDQLGGGNKTIYRTQGDGMGGRKNGGEERAPAGAPRAFSAAKRAEMDYEDQEQPSGKVDQLGGGNKTIYRTQGDGMGGRKSGGEERATAGAPRAFSAAKRAEMDSYDDDVGHASGNAEMLGGGSRTMYRTQGDGMGGRKVVAEEAPTRAPRNFSAAKLAEMGYDGDEQDLKKQEVEQLAGGNRTIYRTQGDGMGGRKVALEDEQPRARAPPTMSAAKRAELGYEDEQDSRQGAEQLTGGNRAIYRTQGDGMGGRKIVAEEAPARAPRAFSAAKRAEMDYEGQEQPSGKVDQLGGGSRTIYKTSGDGMGGRKGSVNPIWGYDEEEPVEKNKENQRQRPNARQDTNEGSFWDF